MTTDRRQALIELRDKVRAGDVPVTKKREAWKLFDIENEGYAYRVNVNAANAYQGSIDAAKALHEAVLPGWSAVVRTNGAAQLHCPIQGAQTPAYNDIPARAWLLAILEALIAQEDTPQ